MLRFVVIVALLAAASGPALAAGRWSTFIRPHNFVDAWAEPDSVWLATREAGALLFRPSLGTFESLHRAPGGLAGNQLNALAFDRSGRGWFATEGQGLSFLGADRVRFGLVNELDGLPSPFVNALEAQGDTLWIGTDGGLALWNGREISGALPDGVNPSPFLSDEVNTIAIAGDSVWVGTADGVYVSRISTGISNTSFSDASAGNGPMLPSRDIRDLATDGRVLFARVSFAGNLFRWDFAAGRWLTESGAGFNIDQVSRITDDRGVILATSATGLWRWTGAAWELLNAELADHPDNFRPPFATTVDSLGRVFSAGRGSVHASPAGGTGTWDRVELDAPVGNNLFSVAVDGPRVYITTFEEGFARWDGARWRNWPPGACTSGCDTTFANPAFPRMVHVDREGVKWIAFWGVGIQSLDDSQSPPVITLSQPSDEFSAERHTFGWSSVSDFSNGHWFGMDTRALGDPELAPIGIDYYDSTGTFVTNYDPQDTPAMENGQVRGLDLDRYGRLWVGYAQTGVDVFAVPATPGDPLEQLFEVFFPGTQDVFGVRAHGDSVWVLTVTNLLRFTITSSSVSPNPRSLALPGPPASLGAVHPLDIAPDGSAWVGTSAGVRHYRVGGGFEDFTTANSPLAHDDVRAVAVDPATGVVWIATAAGLNAYDPAYVPPPAPELPRLDAKVYPNPAMLTALGVTLRVAGNGESYRGTVHDLSGRIVRSFRGVANGAAVWDGRDGDGALVRPGVYFVRLEAGGRTHTARVALLR